VTRAAVLVLLGVLIGVAGTLGTIERLARTSSSSTCATWVYSGTVPALQRAAAEHPGTCG
jgi:hypothetical protein